MLKKNGPLLTVTAPVIVVLPDAFPLNSLSLSDSLNLPLSRTQQNE